MAPRSNRPADHPGPNSDTRELTVRQEPGVPGAIRALGPNDPDYIDVFTLTTPDAARSSSEEWARAAFDDVAALQGQFVWRVLLGLRLERRSAPDHIAGWKIAERGDDSIRLEARSWMLTGHLVMHVEDEQLSMATIVGYDRPLASRIWPPLSAVHRRLAPGLLRDAYEVRRKKSRR
ncbi:hypothetical protein GCM10010252_31020 [Streptomyces aureoverticillatus]|nr:hypothetical protein GCM10010252_31020 [Streptomyces aureoverticillatus]